MRLLDIAHDVETAYLSLEEARAREAVAVQAVAAADETLELVETQYRAGQRDDHALPRGRGRPDAGAHGPHPGLAGPEPRGGERPAGPGPAGSGDVAMKKIVSLVLFLALVVAIVLYAAGAFHGDQVEPGTVAAPPGLPAPTRTVAGRARDGAASMEDAVGTVTARTTVQVAAQVQARVEDHPRRRRSARDGRTGRSSTSTTATSWRAAPRPARGSRRPRPRASAPCRRRRGPRR